MKMEDKSSESSERVNADNLRRFLRLLSDHVYRQSSWFHQNVSWLCKKRNSLSPSTLLLMSLNFSND